MQNSTFEELIQSLNLNEQIEIESIPTIDLYMDQVITLFEDKLKHTKRSESDKLLTKTMINNYAKDKLLMPAVKKKYTREHIILMILLYELKQILTIGDIKTLFNMIHQEEKVDAIKLEKIYKTYLALKSSGVEDFEKEVLVLKEDLEAMPILNESLEEEEKTETEDLLIAILLTQKANYYKRLAEKIIDRQVEPLIKEKGKAGKK